VSMQDLKTPSPQLFDLLEMQIETVFGKQQDILLANGLMLRALVRARESLILTGGCASMGQRRSRSSAHRS
jgi:hypothetical protein